VGFEIALLAKDFICSKGKIKPRHTYKVGIFFDQGWPRKVHFSPHIVHSSIDALKEVASNPRDSQK